VRRLPRHLLLLGLVSVGLVVPASAQAEIVTVGSPLTRAFTPTTVGSASTIMNSGPLAPGANLSSPIDGVIVRWRITQATGGPFALRVLTPVSGQTFTGGAASAPQTPTNTATQTYSTNIPITKGQFIGLNVTDDNDQVGFAFPGNFSFWIPPLANGETRAGTGPSAVGEVGFNADVATIPSNDFSLGKLKKNKNRGTALLTVDVPGPGKLDLSGFGVKPQRSLGGATVSKEVTKAGPVTLRIKAKGKKKTKLSNRGKVKVKVNVTYTPTGDVPGIGTPSTEPRRLKLIDN
jgi:hypothetical protein